MPSAVGNWSWTTACSGSGRSGTACAGLDGKTGVVVATARVTPGNRGVARSRTRARARRPQRRASRPSRRPYPRRRDASTRSRASARCGCCARSRRRASGLGRSRAAEPSESENSTGLRPSCPRGLHSTPSQRASWTCRTNAKHAMISLTAIALLADCRVQTDTDINPHTAGLGNIPGASIGQCCEACASALWWGRGCRAPGRGGRSASVVVHVFGRRGAAARASCSTGTASMACTYCSTKAGLLSCPAARKSRARVDSGKMCAPELAACKSLGMARAGTFLSIYCPHNCPLTPFQKSIAAHTTSLAVCIISLQLRA